MSNYEYLIIKEKLKLTEMKNIKISIEQKKSSLNHKARLYNQ